MLGKPKFYYDEPVSFTFDYLGETHVLNGTVEVIDRYGTWENPDDVSYDIMCKESPMGECLFKHIPEKFVTSRKD